MRAVRYSPRLLSKWLLSIPFTLFADVVIDTAGYHERDPSADSVTPTDENDAPVPDRISRSLGKLEGSYIPSSSKSHHLRRSRRGNIVPSILTISVAPIPEFTSDVRTSPRPRKRVPPLPPRPLYTQARAEEERRTEHPAARRVAFRRVLLGVGRIPATFSCCGIIRCPDPSLDCQCARCTAQSQSAT